MNIGIDIDGVLTEMEQYLLTVGLNFASSNHLPFDPSFDRHSACGFLNRNDSRFFWEKYWFDYAFHVSVKPNASLVIKKLHEEGNRIFLITARTYDSQILKYGISKQQEMEQAILLWLEKNDIYYDKIIFSNLNKLPACLENKIDVMIDDAVSNIEQLQGYMDLILFSSKYNVWYQNDAIRRASNWLEVYALVSKDNKED